MVSEPAGDSSADGRLEISLVGGFRDQRAALRDALAANESVERAEAVPPGGATEPLEASSAGGVVCFPPDDDGDEPGSPSGPIADVVGAVDAETGDCPVAAVGPDVDARAAYRAGATDVVPLPVEEDPEFVAERVVAIVERHRDVDAAAAQGVEGRSAPDDGRTLVEALATASPFYAFICDEDGQYLDVMLGRRSGQGASTESELVGETAHDVFDAETADRIVGTIRESLSAGEVRTMEYALDRGGRSWYRARITPLEELYGDRSVVLLVASEITERKERKRDLERAERRFNAVFNAPSALVTILDTDGRIEEISDAAVALVDEPAGAIEGRYLWEGPWFERDAEIQASFETAVERALDGESARLETDVPLPETELVVDVLFEPITDADGRLTGVLGIARDVTEQHRNRRIRQRLLSTTQELMTVDSRERLARTVSEAAESVLGHELHVVYLRDEGGSLEPISWSEQVGDYDWDEPPSPADDGPATRVQRRGEPVLHDDVPADAEWTPDHGPTVRSVLAVPIGDHGVLAVGATETGALAETDIDRCQLLTVNAAAALDRLERTLELQRYETLFETVQEKLYVLDEDGHVQMVSESLADAVGYDRETLRGRHVSTFVTESTAKELERLTLDLLVTPEDVSSTHEGTLLARDGTETPVEIEVSVLPYGETFRGSVGVVRDISERRQREEELRVFRTVLTETGIGLAMYDDDGRFEFVNDNYAALLGRSRDDLEGSVVWETFESLDGDRFDAYWRSLEVDETATEETDHRRADGSTVPVETVTTAVEIDGERYHAMTVQDITDRRERRQQTQALHRIFRHNLRNDLTVVRGLAGMLSERLSGEHEERAGTIVEKTDDLIELTETATEARRLLKHDTRRDSVDAAEFVRKQAAELRSDTDAAVSLDLPDEQYVRADDMLTVAVENLLSNAVEHNDSSSPRVWVAVGPLEDRADWVAIDVADDGPGIPPLERETLAAGEERPLQHSMGLGLWIVRWIVSRYGGELTIEDREPRGSRVRIALPAAAPEADDGSAGEST